MEVESAPYDVFSTSSTELLPNDVTAYDLEHYQWGSLEDFTKFNSQWESLDAGSVPRGSQSTVPENESSLQPGYAFTAPYYVETADENPDEVGDVCSTCSTLPLRGVVQDDHVIDVTVEMMPGEKRFGFSVMGGSDEGFPPRIDEIASGI